MKTIILILTLLSVMSYSFAQEGSILIAADNAEKMTVVLDGALKNEDPRTQVIIDGVMPGMHKIKVIKHNSGAPQVIIEKTIGVEPGTRSYYNVKLNNKNEYVLRLYNAEPYMANANNNPVITNNPNTTVVQPNPNVVVEPVNPGNVTMSTNTTLPSENMNMNMTITETGVNFNMNVNTTGTPGNNPVLITPSTVPQNNVVVIPANTAVMCAMPTLNPGDFQRAKATISNQSFDDTRATIAKQVIQANCMSVAQIKEILTLFSFEETKLDIAKFAYIYTCDRNKYYEINSVFSFSSSVDELNAHISTIR